MPTFALNFSRPGSQVVAQYYNFLRLGFDGYRASSGYARDVAMRLAGRSGARPVRAASPRRPSCPCSHSGSNDDVDDYSVFDVSRALRERGWQVPAYTFPANRTDLAVLRVVVRRGFTHDMADMLVDDLKRQLPHLERQAGPIHDESTTKAFNH